ncbi:MAG: PA2779 family protein [Gallionella sp.]
MNATLIHRMCVIVLGAALCLQTSAGMAEIVSTDQMAAPNQTDVEKAKVQAFMDRADVKVRLQALGVNELSAKDRVAAMTDQEVHAMAQKIDSMPAGGALSDRDWILILVIVIVLLII